MDWWRGFSTVDWWRGFSTVDWWQGFSISDRWQGFSISDRWRGFLCSHNFFGVDESRTDNVLIWKGWITQALDCFLSLWSFISDSFGSSHIRTGLALRVGLQINLYPWDFRLDRTGLAMSQYSTAIMVQDKQDYTKLIQLLLYTEEARTGWVNTHTGLAPIMFSLVVTNNQ